MIFVTTDSFKIGFAEPNTMKFNLTAVTIGDGSNVGQFAKQVVASAREQDEPKLPIASKYSHIAKLTPEVREMQWLASRPTLFRRL